MDYRTDLAYEAEPQAHQEMRPFEDFLAYWREYSRERPEVTALACFALGFVLGWKLKPW